MSVHPFPTPPVALTRSRGAPVRRPDRVEVVLVAALVLTTAAQFALCAWFWLA